MLPKPVRSGRGPKPRSPAGKRLGIIPHCKLRPAPKKEPAPIARTSGNYFIVYRATDRFYVGSAVNLYMRRRTHWNSLRGGKHANKYLQRAWRRHGEANF